MEAKMEIRRKYEEMKKFESLCFSGDLKKVTETLDSNFFDDLLSVLWKMEDIIKDSTLDICKAIFKKFPYFLVSPKIGGTILENAVKQNRLDLVKFIMDEANTPTKNDRGDDSLTTALIFGNTKIARYFLSIGYSFPKKDSNGNTILSSIVNCHYSYYRDNEKVNVKNLVDFFIDQGIDINSKNNRNFTAFDLAIDEGFFSLAKILVKRGCHVKFDEHINRKEYFIDLFKKRKVKIKLPPLIKIDIFVY